MATAARLVLGYFFSIFSLLRVRLQFGISVVPRRSLYVGIITLFRACSTALHEDER
jgi:hypothetical protein